MSQEVAGPSDGTTKKDLSNDQLKAYIHKARAKIRKLEGQLEEQNKALPEDAGWCAVPSCLLPHAPVLCFALLWYRFSLSVVLLL